MKPPGSLFEEFRIRVKSHENRYPAFIQQVHILAKGVIDLLYFNSDAL
jgi:hypothetical protein